MDLGMRAATYTEAFGQGLEARPPRPLLASGMTMPPRFTWVSTADASTATRRPASQRY